jgi:probable O-glycosylation ligase (exosortase A-associated)
MPQQWYDRMETIKTYQQDSSAQMRFNSWGTMWNLAKSRPLTGGGLDVASHDIYKRYAPDPSFPPQVAHSIYFQALGEHGFVGLGLYLLLMLMLWRKAGALSRLAKSRPELPLGWARDLGLMTQVTLVGFGVGGAFLSLVNFDVPYYLVGIIAATLALVQREAQQQPLAQPVRTPGPVMPETVADGAK